jgi:hypothetical protein
MNPIDACIGDPRLFEAECDGDYLDDHGLKCGYTRMRLVREIELPVLTTEQRVYAAIQCAIATGYADAGWLAWAERWIDGSDRSDGSAAWETETYKMMLSHVDDAVRILLRECEIIEDYDGPEDLRKNHDL